MKSISALILMLLLYPDPAGCQSTAIRQIEVSKESRGYQEHVRVTRDSLTTFIDNSMAGEGPSQRSRPTEPEEWTSLIDAIGDLDLKQIGQLPSPTMDRASDAAMHSSITITTADGAAYSHGYDGENPHDALKPLLKAFRKIAGPSEKP